MFGLFMPIVYFLVVVIAVPICIASSRNKKRRGNNNWNNLQNINNTYSHWGSAPGNTQRNVQRNAQGNIPSSARRGIQANTSGSMQGSVPGNGQRSMQGKASGNTGRNMAGNISGKKTQTQSGSTTEYLEKKAMEDQREHAVEKMEERRRVDAKYGNVPTAKRHILGDPVPSGMKLVCCKYCGAENEVKMGYRGSLACYFCRTEL